MNNYITIIAFHSPATIQTRKHICHLLVSGHVVNTVLF